MAISYQCISPRITLEREIHMFLPIITSKPNHRERQHIYHRIHKISSVTKIIIPEESPTPHEMNQQFCPSSRHDYSPDKTRCLLGHSCSP